MAHHTPVNVNSRELERARSYWHNFTHLLQWGVIGIAILLLGMAATFIDW